MKFLLVLEAVLVGSGRAGHESYPEVVHYPSPRIESQRCDSWVTLIDDCTDKPTRWTQLIAARLALPSQSISFSEAAHQHSTVTNLRLRGLLYADEMECSIQYRHSAAGAT